MVHRNKSIFVRLHSSPHSLTLPHPLSLSPTIRYGSQLLIGAAIVYFFILAIGVSFLMMNLFVVVVTESYEVLADPIRQRIESMIPKYREVWTKFDPKGKGTLLEHLKDSPASSATADATPTPVDEKKAQLDRRQATLKLSALIMQLPRPLGVGAKSSHMMVRAKVHLLMSQPDFEFRFEEILMGLVATWLHHHGIKPSDCDYVDMLRTQFAILKIQNFLRQHIKRFRASHSGSFGAVKEEKLVRTHLACGRGLAVGRVPAVGTSIATAAISDLPEHSPVT